MTFPLEGIFGNNAAANEKKTTGRLGLKFLIGFRAREKKPSRGMGFRQGMLEKSAWDA